jgi:hypothetical protein
VRARYDASVFGIAGRRLAESVVALFAVLGFAFVPLGRKTALEHSRDILTTPAALSAFREAGGAVLRLRGQILEMIQGAPDRSPRPADDEAADRSAGPKATLPRLGETRSGPKR